MQLELTGKRKQDVIQLFSRKTGEWESLTPQEGICFFDLGPAGGDLIKIAGRK